MRKIAIKKLKGSDLSLFQSYFRDHPNVKQKGFNLDQKVLRNFFPAILSLLRPRPKKAKHVDLVLYGPGLSQSHTLARKVKIDAKNIRLNGEIIYNPEDEPDRYDLLIPGDFALMEFRGAALPDEVKVVLVASKSPYDIGLHQALSRYLPGDNASMKVLTESELQAAIAESSPDGSHPIWDWSDPVAFEEIGFGDANAVQKVNRRRAGRGMSPADFSASKEAARRTGQLGEELLNAYFDSPAADEVESHEWISQVNAISPYDFSLVTKNHGSRHIDAKSTSGHFETPLYLSTAELKWALESSIAYDIYRLYDVSELSAKFRVARNIRDKLLPIAELLRNFPDEIKVDALSFKPGFFSFEEEVHSIDATFSDSVDESDMDSDGE